MSSVRVNRVLAPVTTLGPGRRVGLWVQGCGLACPGCASIDTWDRGGGRDAEVAVLAEEILDLAATKGLTGLTLTGGEPVDQAEQLAALLDAVAGDPRGRDLDVLLFTGYPLRAARRRGAALLDRTDTVVAGPYRRERPSGGPLVASANQELAHLTARGKERGTAGSGAGIQVFASGGELTLVGLPRPGDLDRLREGLARRGVVLEGVSWAS